MRLYIVQLVGRRRRECVNGTAMLDKTQSSDPWGAGGPRLILSPLKPQGGHTETSVVFVSSTTIPDTSHSYPTQSWSDSAEEITKKGGAGK